MALSKIVDLLDKVTDTESFRAITLIILLLIGGLFFMGFNHLNARIEKSNEQMHMRIIAIENTLIPRLEFLQMERRLDQYFEQLDKRLDRIENKLP